MPQNNGFDVYKQSLCSYICISLYDLSAVLCNTTTWNDQISGFPKKVNVSVTVRVTKTRSYKFPVKILRDVTLTWPKQEKKTRAKCPSIFSSLFLSRSAWREIYLSQGIACKGTSTSGRRLATSTSNRMISKFHKICSGSRCLNVNWSLGVVCLVNWPYLADEMRLATFPTTVRHFLGLKSWR